MEKIISIRTCKQLAVAMEMLQEGVESMSECFYGPWASDRVDSAVMCSMQCVDKPDDGF